MSLLEVEGLTKYFGGLLAVDDLSFDVEEGEILGLIGPNGSGKSTTFNCIMGIHDATDGRVAFDGEEITNWDTHDVVNRGLVRVSQHSNPIEGFTVRENVRLFTIPNSVTAFDGGSPDAAIAEIAAEVGLEDDLDSYPDSLPHATSRRLEVAKALATEPEMLLVDEPFAGMNAAEVRELSELIERLRREGTTIVVVDHNMSGLMELVDRVVVLTNGHKLAEGTPEEIVEDPEVQEAYLAGSV